MASPQLEDGYTTIANEILHALMACKLLNYEMRVVVAVVRKTYGWKKKSDWISNSQLNEVTGIAKSNITRTVSSLIKKNILVREGKKIGLQKNWELWDVEWYVSKKVISRDNSVISPDNKKLSHQIPTKEKKETIQNKLGETSSQKDMNWKKQADDYEEGVVDLDGDGTVVDEEETKRVAEKELNAKFRKAVDWLIDHQGRDRKRTNIPAQLKAIKKLYTLGVGATEAKGIIIECEADSYWRGKKEKPDFLTALNRIQKRG